jgi:transcriptional regulator with XRE-family HTH domain
VTYSDGVFISVAEVIGLNARKLRLDAGKSLEDVAKAARAFGLPWSTGRVGDFESGKAAPNFTTMYVVAKAIGAVIARPVELAELLAGDGPVMVNANLAEPLADLRAAVSGQPVASGLTGATKFAISVTPAIAMDANQYVRRDFAESDLKMCRRLGVTPDVGAAAMAKLWGHTFRTERDRRAGPDAKAQRRGQISRRLQAELQKAINDGND